LEKADTSLSRVPKHVLRAWLEQIDRYARRVKLKLVYEGAKPNRNGALCHNWLHASGRKTSCSEGAILHSMRKEFLAMERFGDKYKPGEHIRKSALDVVANMSRKRSDEIDTEVFDTSAERFVERAELLNQAYQRENVREPEKPKYPDGVQFSDLRIGTAEVSEKPKKRRGRPPKKRPLVEITTGGDDGDAS
jgi:hypothetical protein